MNFKKILFIFSILSVMPFASEAQTMDEHARSPDKSPIEGGNSKQQKKADKKKDKQKEELDDAIKKGRKQHMSYQDKATKRRMKKSKKKANNWNKR